jgi:hypothetical protein
MPAPASTTKSPKRVAFETTINPSITTLPSAPAKPHTAAKDAFVLGCLALQHLDTSQSHKLAKSFADLLLKIDQKMTINNKFDNTSFLPKPLRLKPSLIASTSVQETNIFQNALSIEANAIQSFQTVMRKEMKAIAQAELESALTDAMKFSVKMIQNLIKYNRKVIIVSGDNSYNELDSDRLTALTITLLKDENFKLLRFDCSNEVIELVLPPPLFTESAYPHFTQDNDLSQDQEAWNLSQAQNNKIAEDITAEDLASELLMIRPIVRSTLIRSLNAFALSQKETETRNEIFLMFEEDATIAAAEDMVMELDKVDTPVTAALIKKVKDALTKDLKNEQVNGLRGAKKGASTKKKSKKTILPKSPKPDASKGNTRNASPNVSSKKKGKPKAPADGKKAKKTKTPKQR